MPRDEIHLAIEDYCLKIAYKAKEKKEWICQMFQKIHG